MKEILFLLILVGLFVLALKIPSWISSQQEPSEKSCDDGLGPVAASKKSGKLPPTEQKTVPVSRASMRSEESVFQKSEYEYKVVSGGDSIGADWRESNFAALLEDLINAHCVDGWEFYCVENIRKRNEMGCLHALFFGFFGMFTGRPPQYEVWQCLIFRRKIK